MAEQWYCEIAGRELGPLSAQQLKAMAAKGQILPSDCVRRGAEGPWVLARQVGGLFPPAPPTSPPPGHAGTQSAAAASSSPPLPPPVPIAANQMSTPSTAPPAPGGLPEGPAPETVDDGAGAAPLDIISELAAVPPVLDSPVLKRARPVSRASAKRQEQQKKLAIGLVFAAVLMLAVAGIILILGGGQSKKMSEPQTTEEKGAVEKAVEKSNEDDTAKAVDKPETASKEQEARAPAGADVVDAAVSPAVVDGVSVKIVSATRPPAPFGDGDDPSRPTQQRLLITVELKNTSSTRKAEFDGWLSGAAARGVRLTDNFGNVYRSQPLGREATSGQSRPTSVYPDKSCKELLAFEPPIGKAEFLLLELPAAAFGRPGVLKLRIPAKMIAEQPVAEPKATGRSKPKNRPGDKATKETRRPGTPKDDFGIGPEDAPAR